MTLRASWLLFAVVVAALPAVASARRHPHRRLIAHAARVARPAPAGPPEVLFTFDDGPSVDKTPRVLDVLDQHHIKAVFFVNGWRFQGKGANAERARELLREMVRRGHAVGNHTVHHYFLCGKLGKRVAADEIERNAQLIEAAIGTRPQLFRTPYGSHCKALAETMAQLGVTPTGWDIDPQDWKVKSTQVVRDYVVRSLKSLRGRAILLLHDVHEDTVHALPQVLDWLEGENAARIARGDPPVQIIDYSYLLPPRPALPPLVDGVGRVLIDQASVDALGRTLRWLGVSPSLPWTS
jgi:peptidoglycan/xylan/chitin deacetylase (PgdA/CDA1 family)